MNALRRILKTWLPLDSFNRSARLFLLATIINGVVFSGWSLFFNFFILARGFDKGFLGLVNSSMSIGALLLGIPLGMLSDRLGRRRSMLIGLLIAMLGMGAQVLTGNPALLILAAFSGGLGNTLYSLSQAPFMMKVSTRENRLLLFSLNSGLITLAGAVGNLFAGQMPQFFARLLNVEPGNMVTYQSVLLASVLLGGFAIIPIYLLREPTGALTEKREAREPVYKAIFQPLVLRLVIPQLFIGLGAATLVPYMNLFLVERFQLSAGVLGAVFSLSALITGLSSLFGPRLAHRLGSKIKTVVVTQSASLAFLMVLGFAPMGWLAVIGFLMRAALMNMASPLYSAFSMEQTPEHQQGTVNSIMTIAWMTGWAVGPYISGIVQQRWGFTPLFISTGILYGLAILMSWLFFNKHESRMLPAAAEIAVVEQA